VRISTTEMTVATGNSMVIFIDKRLRSIFLAAKIAVARKMLLAPFLGTLAVRLHSHYTPAGPQYGVRLVVCTELSFDTIRVPRSPTHFRLLWHAPMFRVPNNEMINTAGMEAGPSQLFTAAQDEHDRNRQFSEEPQGSRENEAATLGNYPASFRLRRPEGPHCLPSGSPSPLAK
jgi:hypothetical protein